MSDHSLHHSRLSVSLSTTPSRPRTGSNCACDEQFNATPHAPALDRAASTGRPLGVNARNEPFFLEGALIEPQTELERLTRFTFEAHAASEGDGTSSESIVFHYRSLDALSVVGSNAFTQNRGHVLAIICFGNNSAAIVPYGSLISAQSYSTPVIGDHLIESNTPERTQQHVSIYFWIPIAVNLHHVTFAEVPCLSVMCFPQMGFLYTGASIIDMLLPETECVHGYSCAIAHYFRSLKQLHLFGDKKAGKALRLQLAGEVPAETRSNGTTSTVTSPENLRVTSDSAVFYDFKANFEIFVFGMMEMGTCFGTTQLECKKLSFSKLAPSICDLQVLVSKTGFLKNLAELQLLSCSIGPDGADVVSKMLSSALHRLEYLSLSRNPLNDEGCTSICDNLTRNTSMTKLSLGDVNATSFTALNLSRLLLNNVSITTLALYENPIEEDGFFSIFDALQTNSSLTCLSLTDCTKFDKSCAAKLIHLLRFNVQLTEIKVSGNPIGRELDQEIAMMCFANQKLKAGTNWSPEDNVLNFMYFGGITKTKFGLDLYSIRAHEITILMLCNNSYDHASIERLCAMLHGFSNLQHFSLDCNSIGSMGLIHLGNFVTSNTKLQALYVANCSIEFLPRSFVSTLVNLKTCSLAGNPLIPWPASVTLCQNENAHDICKLFSEPIDNVLRASWISIQEYLTHRCNEEGLEMFLGLIQFKEDDKSQFCTSDCAKLWTTIIGIAFEEENLHLVVEKFIDRNIPAWNSLAFCADEYDRKAIMLAVGATKQFLMSRCFFMGLYDIPDDLQHEYKSATCTVYVVDRVEHNKRTRVALKIMKNAVEFEREKTNRENLSALNCQNDASQDCIIGTIASYDSSNVKFQAAVQRRGWLVDYDSPSLLVMPAADRNLRIIMDNERITKPDVIKGMFQQILNCVKFIHERGYIHGDLKPRNIMRILHHLKLIDFDSSAQIGHQYSWSKHSSAYMPPEAIHLSLSLGCSVLCIAPVSISTQFIVSFVVSLPHNISSGSAVTISIAPIMIIAVYSFVLDEIDLSSCIYISNGLITFIIPKDALVAGDRALRIEAKLDGDLPEADSISASVKHAVNTHSMARMCQTSLANCIPSVRNPGMYRSSNKVDELDVPSALRRQQMSSLGFEADVASSFAEPVLMPIDTHEFGACDFTLDVPLMCTCDRFFPPGFCTGDAPNMAGCIGLCGLAHISHDMWALGVILYRMSARESLFSEDDEDNIKGGTSHLLELALWTDAFKEERLQKIDDTATRELVSKMLEKDPWKRPCCIDEVLAMPFHEIDVVKQKLRQVVLHDAPQSSNLVGSVNDLSTGKFKDAAKGLRHYLQVADTWKEEDSCSLQGMQSEVDLLKDCPDCARVQAVVLKQLGHINVAIITCKLASALDKLSEQRKLGTTNAEADIVAELRSDIAAVANGWHYGLPNSVLWPTDSVKVGFTTFCQPMCKACQRFCLDYSSISADFHYIVHEAAVEHKFWNGTRDHGRAGRRLADFMALPQAVEANLTEAELAALRFYTSHSFNSINVAMRDQQRTYPHPLSGIVTNIQRSLKKLRTLGSDDASSKQTVVLWRGMSDMKLPQQFNAQGGTELAPMSTTTDVSVAISYAVKKDTRSALLFRFVTRNNLERGADVQWLSMFPGESETLFPPLTFLQRTRTETQEVEHNGVMVIVVELSTTLA